MALIKCPECGKEVSSESKTCPNCGKQLKRPVAPAVLTVLSILMSVWLVYVFLVPAVNFYVNVYLQPHGIHDFPRYYWVLFPVVGTALVSGVLFLINSRIDSKPLNTIGIVLSIASLAIYVIYIGLNSELSIFFPFFITPPILSLVAGFKLRK